jgi:hypothetical protein
MKRFLTALALLCLLPSVPLHAEEPHLAFVRALCASGKADLALQYLQSQSQKFPAELKEILPLEQAQMRLELATAQPDTTRREALQDQARNELDAFIRRNPKHPLAAVAAFKLAQIMALRGRSQLSQARCEGVKETQRAEMLRARGLFEEAAKKLLAAKAQIDKQLQVPATPAMPSAQDQRETLSDSQLQAELDKGINLVDQAQTYTEESELPQRAALIQKARDEILDRLARREPKTSYTWQAIAWIGRCQFEDDDPKKARKTYMDVINADAGEQANAGRRLARSFRMQALAADADQKKAQAEVVNAGEEWLRLYPNYLNTPEGQSVRFALANAYLKQARALPKTSSQARDKYESARKQFQILEQTANDYTAAAHENRLNIVLLTSLERTKGDINKLRDFEECYLRAELESARIAQAMKDLSGDKREKERTLRFRNMVEALTRGLDLADARSSAEDVHQARLLLAYSYLALGDYYRAAVAGEDLARSEPKTAQAPLGGAYALSAYAQLIAKQAQAGTPPEALTVERTRQRQLAQYIERTWPTSQAADIARHLLGAALLAEKNYAEAVEVLDRISPSYSDSTRSLYELASAALKAKKIDLKPPPSKPAYEQRALAALARIPDLRPSADPATTRDYFAAKLLLADIYYRANQPEKLDALSQTLAKRLDGCDRNVQEAFRTPILSLSLYAKLGRGEMDYKAGRYGKTRELLGPVVKKLTDPAKAAELADLREKDPQLLRAVLGLALRASVQDNHVDQGKAILELLQQTFPENSFEILVQLIQQLRTALQELRQQGAPAREQLNKTVASFSTFLDELTKQQQKNAKPDMLLFLGQSYSSLDKHDRAAELLNTIQPDAPPALYHLARVLYVRELRLAKDYSKAEATLKEILASDWGKQYREAKKEGIFLLEDQEQYQLSRTRGAIPEWNQLMQSLRPRLQDNRIKEEYFDCYYHLTYCIFRNALKKSDKKQRQHDIHVAAGFIAWLEEQQDSATDGCKKRFQELLRSEPLLKQEYEAIKHHASN